MKRHGVVKNAADNKNIIAEDGVVTGKDNVAVGYSAAVEYVTTSEDIPFKTYDEVIVLKPQ